MRVKTLPIRGKPGRLRLTSARQCTARNWWLLKVRGPMPGRPAERGEFVMEVSFYGDPPGWWITVGEDALSAASTHGHR